MNHDLSVATQMLDMKSLNILAGVSISFHKNVNLLGKENKIKLAIH